MGDKEHVQAELRKRILHSKGLLKKKKKNRSGQKFKVRTTFNSWTKLGKTLSRVTPRNDKLDSMFAQSKVGNYS